jgi:hypothetical protein
MFCGCREGEFLIHPVWFSFLRKVESASLSRGNAQKVKKAAWLDRNKKLTQSEGEVGGKEFFVDAEKWDFLSTLFRLQFGEMFRGLCLSRGNAQKVKKQHG